MSVISIRGVDEKAVSFLKKQAEHERSSLIFLVVKVLQTAAGVYV
jgi:hypothetical protein